MHAWVCRELSIRDSPKRNAGILDIQGLKKVGLV